MATQALDKPGYAGPELKSDKANKKTPQICGVFRDRLPLCGAVRQAVPC
jgi:hypothetical protein